MCCPTAFTMERGYSKASVPTKPRRHRGIQADRAHGTPPSIGQGLRDPVPFGVDELVKAEPATAGRQRSWSPAICARWSFYGLGSIGLNPAGAEVRVIIAAWRWGAYLGEEGLKNGIRTRVSSWRRIDQSMLNPERQRHRRLFQFDPRQAGSSQEQLRRGDSAQQRGFRFGGERREHLSW